MALTDILSGAASFGKSLLQPSRAIDVVAILGPGYTPLFSLARPLTATVYEDAKLMEHPLETGSSIADHIVFEPVEIELPMVLSGEVEYRQTYAAIKGAFKAGTLLTVSTRSGLYPDMVVTSMPHDERANSFDALEMNIRLRHAVFVTPKTTDLPANKVADPKQASTVKKGGQQTTGASAAKTSAAATAKANSGTANTPAAGAAASGSTLYQWTYGA